MPTNAMGQAAATAAGRGIAGRSSTGAGGTKSGYGLMGYKADGPGPRSTAGGKVSPSKGERPLALKSSGKAKTAKSFWEKYQDGDPLTEDELAQLSPEQAAYYQSIRSEALFG